VTLSRTHLVARSPAPVADDGETIASAGPDCLQYGPDEDDRVPVSPRSRSVAGSTPVVWAALLVGLLGLGALFGA
jgi:hypothetical protein